MKLALALIAIPSLLIGSPVITEILSVNDSTLADGDGRFSDWIELHNPDATPVDLAGHVLADSDGEWAFPSELIVPPDGYLILFASGRNELDAGGHWHTDFRLGRSGESLSLLAPTGEILSAFEDMPEQRNDVSFGVASNDSIGYFENPTPGTANNVVTLGYVGDTKFSVDRGYHSEAFEVTISVEPEDAIILYTTDGSDPSKGSIFTGPHGRTYAGPIEVTSTTVLKALAYKNGWQSSNVDAQTYIFIKDVLRQPLEGPDGYPEKWGGTLGDYGMDEEVVDDPAYSSDFEDAFAAFPTLSISLDRDDLFGTKGIHQNTLSEGPEWERATSVEFIFPDDASENFQVPCGIRIQGGSSRAVDIPKHSFSLRLREEYGLGALDYPLFTDQPSGENATESFDYLQLRSGFNFAWTHRHYYQSKHAQYNRDQFVNDTYLAMGHPGIHGRWFHLYLNGLYWGVYHMHERPDANFMASYFGGSKEDYDAVNSGEATDGNLNSWNAMWSLARQASDPDAYAELQELLHVDALIDYMILNFYVGNWDWDGHNWRAAGRSADAEQGGGGWFFFPWDSEFAISPNGAGAITNPEPIENALTIDRTQLNGGANRPTGLHRELLASAEYKRRFEDRVYKHFFNGGVFTPERATEIWKTRSDVMDRAVIAESARWGDYKRDRVPGRWAVSDYALYTKNSHYLPNQKFILDRYLKERPEIVLEQMRKARLIGSQLVPEFEIAGVKSSGGEIPMGKVLRLSGGAGFFYTVDGISDPTDADALAYDKTVGIVLESSALVRVRTQSIFGEWSPLAEAFFIVGESASSANLVISEIHYRPTRPNETEQAAGHLLRSDFEFLELRNRRDSPINLVGVQFVNGVSFAFANDAMIEAGERALLVGNAEAFKLRYPEAASKVVGQFQGSLRDSGETLELLDSTGVSIQRVRYDDEDEKADGEGHALVSDGLEWKAGAEPGGSPGALDSEITSPAMAKGVLMVTSDLQIQWNQPRDTAFTLEMSRDLKTWEPTLEERSEHALGDGSIQISFQLQPSSEIRYFRGVILQE
jgi:hypothetical protein